MPRCPVCTQALQGSAYEGVNIFRCGNCAGHWLEKLEMARIVRGGPPRVNDAPSQELAQITNETNSVKPLWCLGCGREMIKESFQDWDAIQIDRCPKCEGIWLDRGELEKCQILWEMAQLEIESGRLSDLQRRRQELDAAWAERRARQAGVRHEIESGPPMVDFKRRDGRLHWLFRMLTALNRAHK